MTKDLPRSLSPKRAVSGNELDTPELIDTIALSPVRKLVQLVISTDGR